MLLLLHYMCVNEVLPPSPLPCKWCIGGCRLLIITKYPPSPFPLLLLMMLLLCQVINVITIVLHEAWWGTTLTHNLVQVVEFLYDWKQIKTLLLQKLSRRISFLSIYCKNNHYIIAKMFEEEMNSLLREEMEKWLPKRDKIYLVMQLSNSFLLNVLSKKIIYSKKMFLKYVGLLIVKNHMPMQFVEILWMECLCLHEFFSFWNFFVKMWKIKNVKEYFIIDSLNLKKNQKSRGFELVSLDS